MKLFCICKSLFHLIISRPVGCYQLEEYQTERDQKTMCYHTIAGCASQDVALPRQLPIRYNFNQTQAFIGKCHTKIIKQIIILVFMKKIKKSLYVFSNNFVPLSDEVFTQKTKYRLELSGQARKPFNDQRLTSYSQTSVRNFLSRITFL